MVPHLSTGPALCRRLTARISPSISLILSSRPLQHYVLPARRAMSSRPVQISNMPLTPGATLSGQSGRMYTIQEGPDLGPRGLSDSPPGEIPQGRTVRQPDMEKSRVLGPISSGHPIRHLLIWSCSRYTQPLHIPFAYPSSRLST
jgi:hypothetical protein